MVQGAVNSNEFYLFKPALRDSHRALITQKLGGKGRIMRYAQTQNEAATGIENTDTLPGRRATFVLTKTEAEQLDRWCLQIEEHYDMLMDIDWPKDSLTNQIFIVQARPETIHHGH